MAAEIQIAVDAGEAPETANTALRDVWGGTTYAEKKVTRIELPTAADAGRVYSVQVPTGYDSASNTTCKINVMLNTTAGGGNGIALVTQVFKTTSDEAMDSAGATAVTHEVTLSVGASDLAIGTVTLTHANLDSPSAGDMLNILIYRDVDHADDDYNYDVWLCDQLVWSFPTT